MMRLERLPAGAYTRGEKMLIELGYNVPVKYSMLFEKDNITIHLLKNGSYFKLVEKVTQVEQITDDSLSEHYITLKEHEAISQLLIDYNIVPRNKNTKKSIWKRIWQSIFKRGR